MQIKIELSVDDAAFSDDFTFELMRVFKQCAEHCESCGIADASIGRLRDSNGNTVGKIELARD